MQFGSMDEEEVIKKPLLPPLSTMNRKKPLSFFLLSEAQVLSLKAALILGCIYAGAAVYNLRDRDPPCQCQCCCQEPEAEPGWASWIVRSYVLTGADAVDAAHALLRGLLWCSALQAAAAALALALALALLAGGRSRRGLGVRAAACVALAATAASHCIYLKMIGQFRVDSFLAVETACVAAAAVLDVLGFAAFVLGVGGDEALARAG